MRVVASSDWRDGIPFETPFILSEVLPGEPARCSVCGGSSDPVDRAELWAVKHRHPKNHDGFVRFYCADHLPARPTPVVEAPVRVASSRARSGGSGASRRSPAASVPERPAVLCPECFVEVPATGVCGICGTRVG